MNPAMWVSCIASAVPRCGREEVTAKVVFSRRYHREHLVEFVERGEILRVVGAEDRGMSKILRRKSNFVDGRPHPRGQRNV